MCARNHKLVETAAKWRMTVFVLLTSAMAQYPVSAEIVCMRDITKFIRETGIGSYSVTLGEGAKQLASCPVANAFDGVTASGDAYRVLLGKDHGEPMQFIYTISDSVYPGYGFTVCSMTLFRLRGSDDATDRNRSPKAFTLEALDGTGWKTLLSVDSQTWGSSTYAKSYDIPVANRGDYRSYRFTITENNDQWWGGVQEIVFDGIVTPNLVWTGLAGARWNATDANWIDGMGTATNWIPGAKATFGARGSAAVIVEDTNEVSSIEFSVTNSCIISGGALAIISPGGIKAGKDDVIASDLIDAQLDGVLLATERLPADPTDTNKGLWTLLWRNCSLSSITGFSGATIDQGGTLRTASAQRFVNDGSIASAQFQHMISGGGALVCVKVLFEQNGADVWGRVAYAKYSYADGRMLGDDMDVEPTGWVEGGNKIGATTVKGGVSQNGYGIYGIVPSGDNALAMSIGVACGDPMTVDSSYGDRFLPANVASGWKTGDPVLYFPDCKLEDLSSVSGADLYYLNGTSPRASSMHYFINDGLKASIQVQGDSGGSPSARICIKVEFTQGADGVYARVVYAKYDWGDDRAHDFDNVPADGDHQATIRDEDHCPSSGAFYGVKNLVGIFKGRRVTLTGDLATAGGLSVGEGATLTFGASAVSLDRVLLGDGTVRFAPPVGSQTVSVTGARSLDNVAFGGATTFTFAEGASLSVGSAEIESAAAVSVVGKAGANLLRIGTSKCLTSAERVHFTVNGGEATQDTAGWIVPIPAIKIILR